MKKRFVEPDLVDLLLAGRRILKSESGTLVRKRARQELLVATKKLLKLYPENEQIIRKPGAVCVCPFKSCGIPLKNWSAARNHFWSRHLLAPGRVAAIDICLGCKQPFGQRVTRTPHPYGGKDKIQVYRVNNPRGVERHLAALHARGKLEQHLVAGVADRVFGRA